MLNLPPNVYFIGLQDILKHCGSQNYSVAPIHFHGLLGIKGLWLNTKWKVEYTGIYLVIHETNLPLKKIYK